jgi:hypothetical protein
VQDEAWPAEDEHGWGPIGVLSGLAERLGGAVSETVGLDVEPEANGDGRPAVQSHVEKDA